MPLVVKLVNLDLNLIFGDRLLYMFTFVTLSQFIQSIFLCGNRMARQLGFNWLCTGLVFQPKANHPQQNFRIRKMRWIMRAQMREVKMSRFLGGKSFCSV